MNMADLPPSLQDERALGWSAVIDRLTSLDLTVIQVTQPDTVEASALPWLARQFHVPGWEGWRQATDEAARRALLAAGLQLHRHKGTPWAVERACTLGGEVVEAIQERFPVLRYDGEDACDGRWTYSGGERWASFRVTVSSGDAAVNAERQERLTGLIDAWKNARSQLHDVSFHTQIMDSYTRQWTAYDGIYEHDGSREYVGTKASFAARLAATVEIEFRFQDSSGIKKTIDGFLFDDMSNIIVISAHINICEGNGRTIVGLLLWNSDSNIVEQAVPMFNKTNECTLYVTWNMELIDE